MLRALNLILSIPNKTKPCKPGKVALAYISTWEAGTGVQGHHWLHSEIEASLSCVSSFLRKTTPAAKISAQVIVSKKRWQTEPLSTHAHPILMKFAPGKSPPPKFLACLRHDFKPWHKDQKPEIESCWCVWICYVCSLGFILSLQTTDSHYHGTVEETAWRDGMVGTQFWFYTVGKPDLHPLGLLPHLWKEKLGCIWIPSALHVLFQFVSVTKDFELGRGRMPIHQTTNSLK